MSKLHWQYGVQMKGWDLCIKQFKGCAMSEVVAYEFSAITSES